MKNAFTVMALAIAMLATVMKPSAFADNGYCCPTPECAAPCAPAVGTCCCTDLAFLGAGVVVVAGVAAALIATSGQSDPHAFSH